MRMQPDVFGDANGESIPRRFQTGCFGEALASLQPLSAAMAQPPNAIHWPTGLLGLDGVCSTFGILSFAGFAQLLMIICHNKTIYDFACAGVHVPDIGHAASGIRS
mmetsp:Transcript_65834/g.110506  ORF Transcript_65834/g.110506 Transcript_65834/m.110506 type:complete len:106 (-) Transcript_65834:104-421(-)